MATGTWEVYAKGMQAILNKEVDLHSNSNLVVICTSSSHTPNQTTHDYANDLTNVVSGTNLSSSGIPVTGATVSTSGTTVKVDIDDISVSTVTATGIRNLHLVDTTSGSASTNPLIAYCTLDGDLSPSAGTLAITIDADGVFEIAV